jgi:hypothetical protein
VRVDLEGLGRAARQVSLAVQALLVTRGALHTVRDAVPAWLDDAAAAPAVRRLVEDLDVAAVAGLSDAADLLDDLRRAAADYALVERAATVPGGPPSELTERAHRAK